MERKFYTDDFEQLLKEKTEHFKMYPSDTVWKSIHQRIHGKNRRRWLFMLVFLFLTAGGTYYMLGNNISSEKRSVAENENLNQPIADNNQQENTGRTEPVLSSQDRIGVNTGITLSDNSATTQSSLHSGINDNTVVCNPTGKNAQRGFVSNPSYKINRAKKTTGSKTSITAAVLSEAKNNTSLEKDNILSNDIASSVLIDEVNKNTPVAIADEISTDEGEKLSNIAENDIATNENASNSRKDDVIKNQLDLINTNSLAWQVIPAVKSSTRSSRWSWNVYATVNSSYRKLLEENPKFFQTSQGIQIAPSASLDVNDVVSHKPSLGAEAGIGISYDISKVFRVRTGLQFNYNKYYIKAYSHSIESALVAPDPNNYQNTIISFSSYRSSSVPGGLTPVSLQNNYFQVSVPLGVDMKLAGNNSLQWYVGASIQPTYNLFFNTYFISADKKNYVEANDFLRRWNLNTSFETGISFRMKNGFMMQIAPQARYQMHPSYIPQYPIKEFLLEWGLKFVLRRPFK